MAENTKTNKIPSEGPSNKVLEKRFHKNAKQVEKTDSDIGLRNLHHQSKDTKKGYKEYLLEGLMIFVAVTLGFFAESLREHLGDKAKEKEYLVTLVEELKNDRIEYKKTLDKIIFLNAVLDSAYRNVRYAKTFNYTLLGKWNTPINTIRVDYKPTLSTIDQMKSSGNLRLIGNTAIANNILSYESFVKSTLLAQQSSVLNAAFQIYQFEDKMGDYDGFNASLNGKDQTAPQKTPTAWGDIPLYVKDPVKLNSFANSFVNYRAINYIYIETLHKSIEKASNLIKEIENEYNLRK